ncbi:hypothetical protein PhaeoP75_04207 (plasmid) [Phaeobacter gallaeciensis]|nr:hypothetical protein PhaeoP75_04207 [Phaeobacter gallaeciensis]
MACHGLKLFGATLVGKIMLKRRHSTGAAYHAALTLTDLYTPLRRQNLPETNTGERCIPNAPRRSDYYLRAF